MNFLEVIKVSFQASKASRKQARLDLQQAKEERLLKDQRDKEERLVKEEERRLDDNANRATMLEGFKVMAQSIALAIGARDVMPASGPAAPAPALPPPLVRRSMSRRSGNPQ